MAKFDYSKRLDNLKKRRQDQELIKKGMMLGNYEILNESYEKLKESSNIKYVIGAMQPVDTEYTSNTYAQGDRVKNQLVKLKDKGYDIEFKYQGSVTNNTHIKAASDIDLLTIHLGFHTLESPQIVTNPYKGNPVKDLCHLREDSYSILRSAFPSVVIDNSGSKSICLQGGSLSRKVDVVPANWYNTVKYAETGLDYYRGIMILDYKNKVRLSNTPFYHNKLLNDKDVETARNYKKVIRLLKTLKADSDVNINLSSYDIAALMYHMDSSDYLIGNSPLVLIRKSLDYMKKIYENNSYRNSLIVPDGSRSIFEDGKATTNDLRLLIIELNSIYQDLLDDLKISGNTINKEIVA